VQKRTLYIIVVVVFFSIAMGFLESSVVVYLRELYYPDGFDFPLKATSITVAITEFIREAATIIMLLSIALISGRNAVEKFSFFLFSFAVWDIFYYIFLKLLSGWPASLLTWDVLFLIPFTWVGPVIAPVINSVTMIVLALMIMYFTENKGKTIISLFQWLLLISGSLIVITAYTEEYVRYMLQYFTFSELFNYSENNEIMKVAGSFVPKQFKWYIFWIGSGFHFAAIILLYCRNKKQKVKTI